MENGEWRVLFYTPAVSGLDEPVSDVGTMHKPLESVPRAVLTRYINAPIGLPRAVEAHHEIIATALDLLQEARGHRMRDDPKTLVIGSRLSPVARATEIAEGAQYGVWAAGTPVLLVRLNGTIHAIGRICTHEYADLAEGELDDGCVVCPLHGSKFDVITGRALTLPAFLPEPIYEVAVLDGVVYVAIQ